MIACIHVRHVYSDGIICKAIAIHVIKRLQPLSLFKVLHLIKDGIKSRL